MSYNRSFRNTAATPGRYNTGKFVSAGELGQQQQQTQQQQQGTPMRATRSTVGAISSNASYSNLYPSQSTAQPPPPPPTVVEPEPQDNQFENMNIQEDEVKTEATEVDANGAAKAKPHWMKTGVKKISNKERRRRQNETLRRLLSPKNALMVLNEMMGDPERAATNNFTVEEAPQDPSFFHIDGHRFCAAFTVEGKIYKGFGENKIAARNAAAEQAIRDLIVKRMRAATAPPPAPANDLSDQDQPMGEDGEPAAAAAESEPLPMIQLASYALHKLFAEWQFDGFQAKGSSPEQQLLTLTKPQKQQKPKAPKPPKPLPADAVHQHPCVLLTNMRQGLVYCELGVEGDKPQNMMYTMGVTVDGTTYIGKASSKKEARRLAARSACQDVFKLQYPNFE